MAGKLSRALRVQQNDFRLQPQQSGLYCLLVVRQSSALTPFSIQFTLQGPNALHQMPFVETLQRVV
jgi:hypothetical protein